MAIERDPPAGGDAVAWLLRTRMPISSTDAALARLEWDACRWGIAVWHTVLTRGCRIADRQRATADRLIRCLTRSRVIAWRMVNAPMLARAVPNAPCPMLLDADAWPGWY